MHQTRGPGLGAHWRRNLLEDESINCLALLSEDLKALQHDCSRRLLCLLPLYRPLRRRQIHEVKLSRDQGHAKGQAAKSETVKALAKVSSKTNRTQSIPNQSLYTQKLWVCSFLHPLFPQDFNIISMCIFHMPPL